MGGRRGTGTMSTGASERNGGRRERDGLRSGAAAYNTRRTTTLLRHVSLGGSLAKGSVVKLAAAERMQEGYRKELSPPTGVKKRRNETEGGRTSGTTGDVSWTGSRTGQPPALPGGLQCRHGVHFWAVGW